MLRRRKLPAPEPPPKGFVLRRGKSGTLEEFPIRMIQEMSQFFISRSEDPSWRNDPTYNLRRKK